jgi:hypothetical protein
MQKICCIGGIAIYNTTINRILVLGGPILGQESLGPERYRESLLRQDERGEPPRLRKWSSGTLTTPLATRADPFRSQPLSAERRAQVLA